MADNPKDGKLESYHEVPAQRYIFLFDTAIHKRFFLIWTLITFATATLCTFLLIASAYPPITGILVSSLLSFLLLHWWITPTVLGTLSIPVTVKIMHKRRAMKTKNVQKIT